MKPTQNTTGCTRTDPYIKQKTDHEMQSMEVGASDKEEMLSNQRNKKQKEGLDTD